MAVPTPAKVVKRPYVYHDERAVFDRSDRPWVPLVCGAAKKPKEYRELDFDKYIAQEDTEDESD